MTQKRGKVKADTCTTHANIATHQSTLQRPCFASRKITYKFIKYTVSVSLQGS